jgi:thiol-disulfide isomerase/thioredoxin
MRLRLGIGAVLVAALAACSSTGGSIASSAQSADSTGKPDILAADKAPQVPDVALAASWINSPPLSRKSLLGKVTWIDFWDASCINCRRTFPQLQKIYADYKDSGFTIVGVHTPEFAFEKPDAYVKANADRLGVTWPVANDPDMAIWNAFGNDSWPAQYLVDKEGRVRYAHVGEGDDDVLEAVVRQLLSEGSSKPLPAPVSATPSPQADVETTPERYLGAERGSESLDQGVVDQGADVTRKDPTPAPANLVALTGRFHGEAEYLEAEVGSQVALSFTSKEVYSVLEPASLSSTVEVLLDGKPVPPDQRGPDLTVDSQGRTIVTVTRSDLWHLLTNSDTDGGGIRSGVLTLIPLAGALHVSTFTFGT